MTDTLRTKSDNELEASLKAIKDEIARRKQIKNEKLLVLIRKKEQVFIDKLKNIDKLLKLVTNDSYIPEDPVELEYFISTGNWSK